MTQTQQDAFEAILSALILPADPTVQVLTTETADPDLSYSVDTHQGPYGLQSTLRATAVVDGVTYTRVCHVAGAQGVASTCDWAEMSDVI